MGVEIMLLRHGETEANLAEVWQGAGDSPLTERGTRQARAAGRRLRHQHFDVVITSDLGRAMATAAQLDGDVVKEPAWQELDMGEWDGMTRAEIFRRFGDQLGELRAGKDIRWGGAESYVMFVARIDAALDRLVASLDDGGRALVVTHGGVIHAVVAGILGFRTQRRPWPVGRIHNASLTTLRVKGAHRAVEVFNDGSHLDGDHLGHGLDGREITLIRHGETEANAASRWQGRTDGQLSARGRQQVVAAAPLYRDLEGVVSSPLRRARDTAAAIASHHGLTLEELEDLVEMDFGRWEDLTAVEIQKGWREAWRRIFEEGEDLARGEDGETFAAVASRMRRAIESLDGPARRVGVVSHGAAIRAYLSDVVGLPYAGRTLLGYPRNTSASSVVLEGWGPVLVDHNVAPHLDDEGLRDAE